MKGRRIFETQRFYKNGVKDFIKKGKTEIVDYTGKGLVMPGCGNGHAHYSMAHGINTVGTMIDRETIPEKFLAEIVPAAVKKARDTGAKYFLTIFFLFFIIATNF